MHNGVSPPLLGRTEECGVVDRLLDDARSGRGKALVLRGEAGIGKSALLRYAEESADDMHVSSVTGVQAESSLPYAGLHQLLGPLHRRIDDLPGPQQNALGAAFGLVEGGDRGRFLTDAAALTLLSNVAAEQPVLWTIDDADRLDAASTETLGFVSRRLGGLRAALVFATARPVGAAEAYPGTDELAVRGISSEAARQLFARAAGGAVDPYVSDRVVAEAHGNPLALIAMSTELTGAQLAGSAALPDLLPLGALLEQRLLAEYTRLPQQTRDFLLLVSARRSTDDALLLRAATALGITPTTVESARTNGILRAGEQIAFRHPFTRVAIYSAAALVDRRRMHEALAAAADPSVNPDLRAWHLAAASETPDENVAAELERTAEAAKRRGGYPAAATFLRRAAQLSPDRAKQTERLLASGSAELAGGHLLRTAALLDEAAQAGLTERKHQALAQRLRGALALASGDNTQTSETLLDAARGLARFDARMAREAYLEALEAAVYAGHLDGEGGVRKTAEAAQKAPRVPKTRMRGLDYLLDGYAALFTDGSAAATPLLRSGIELLRRGGDLRWLGLANLAAWEIWDEQGVHATAQRRIRLARRAGALAILPNALAQLAGYETAVGRFDDAIARLDESRQAFASSGHPGIIGRSDVGRLMVTVWQGRENEARALAELCKREATARGQGTFVNVADLALAVLENGLGRYDAAFNSAKAALAHRALWSWNRALPELVEAAARLRRHEAAKEALEQLEESTRASGTSWALGVLARCQALTAGSGEDEELYREAIGHLERCRVTPDLARARLLYGEWLRRRRRRRDARDELRAALEMFTSMGATAFAERARRELLATGERSRKRIPGTEAALTPRELRIAGLAVDGDSNAEIAARLFISPRTVEYHLHKVFRKLGMSSRRELTHSLLERETPPTND